MVNIEEIKNKGLELLKDFKGCVEIDDFQRFLMMNFAGGMQGPANMLSMLGMADKPGLSLNFDPMRNLYFHMMLGGNQEHGLVFIYCRKEAITEKYIEKDLQDFFKDTFTSNEMELLGIGIKKKKLVHVRATDFQVLEKIKNPNGKKVELGIDLVYSDLEGFMSGHDLKANVFLLEADEGDLVFDITFKPFIKRDDVNLLSFDIYFDEEKRLRGKKYVQINMEDASLEFTDEIKSLRAMKQVYCNIIPVKSFNVP
ncbi:MAG: hypothetical protein ACTSUE_12650 [Promethearchaeota archaeon]